MGNYYCMLMHFGYGQKGGVSIVIVIVIVLICIDMHHCVMSLKEACTLVHKGTNALSQAKDDGLGAHKGGSWVWKGKLCS